MLGDSWISTPGEKTGLCFIYVPWIPLRNFVFGGLDLPDSFFSG